jgi:RHS repeat-associated protein
MIERIIWVISMKYGGQQVFLLRELYSIHSNYPSGLPWASNSIDNPITQPYKYNGKEFVEMHGYDTYDYGARGYYPAMGRFTSVDPLAEKYYSISPYTYCVDKISKCISC